jgi:hypothetical protein
MRSPVVALLALGSLLSCQILCPYGRVSGRADSSKTHEARLAELSDHDFCCDPILRGSGQAPAPANPDEESSCCFFCCCSGAVLTQSLPLEHLTLTAILPLPWFLPGGEVEPTHAVVDSVPDLLPPEPSRGTIVLLI